MFDRQVFNVLLIVAILLCSFKGFSVELDKDPFAVEANDSEGEYMWNIGPLVLPPILYAINAVYSKLDKYWEYWENIEAEKKMKQEARKNTAAKKKPHSPKPKQHYTPTNSNDDDEDDSYEPYLGEINVGSFAQPILRPNSGSLERQLLRRAKKMMKYGIRRSDETMDAEYHPEQHLPKIQTQQTFEIMQTEKFSKWYASLSSSDRNKINEKIKDLLANRRNKIRTFAGGELEELKFGNGLRVYITTVEKTNTIWLVFGGDKHGQSQDIENAEKMLDNIRNQ